MPVSNLRAAANPRGGCVDLSWTNPGSGSFGGVRVLRRQTAFPGTGDPAEDQEIVNIPAANKSAGAFVQFSDENLKGETVYYYAVVPYDAASNPLSPGYASAMTTISYQSAAHLYNNLPSVYRRYDSILPPSVPELDPRDTDKGQLQRVLELFGLQFDLLRSFASGQQRFHNRREVEGALLPLLASWVAWETNHELGLDKQRNEIQYATNFYRTTGIAASLRGTVNRLVTWDARIKEFVHSVFGSTMPEQLTLWEKQEISGNWQDAERVSLDIAYEGRPATLTTSDQRQWLFHHARQSAPVGTGQHKSARDRWHIWYKILEQDEWLAAHRVSSAGEINKYPTAVQDDLNRVWVFWAGYQGMGAQTVPSIRLALMAAGQPARPAQAKIVGNGPYVFVDGEVFEIKVTTPATTFSRRIIFRADDFANPAAATLAETVALLNREIPDVQVTTNARGEGLLTTEATGTICKLEFPASAVGIKLGLGATATGSNALAAQIVGALNQPFALTEGDAISIRIDDRLTRVVTFNRVKAGGLSAAEVADAINSFLPGIAEPAGQQIKLRSPTTGAASSILVEVFAPFIFSMSATLESELDAGTISPLLRSFFTRAGSELSAAATLSIQAPGSRWVISDGGRTYNLRNEGAQLNVYNTGLAAPKLGFGVPLPSAPAGIAETEPSAIKDGAGRIWLFWSSQRTGVWKIWYNRFDGTNWGAAKPLTTGANPDREPAALFVPASGGRLWVFWSRKKPNGLWNIFFTNTSNLDFNTLGAGDWRSPPPELTPVPPKHDNREPAAIVQAAGSDAVELYFSSNQIDGWQVWSRGVTLVSQSADSQITTGQFTHRAPAVLKVPAQLKKLYFRSNESETYTSAVYPLAQTIDARYSGSTTVDTRNSRKISLRKNIQDIQRYTYDTVKSNDRWYARDTVGIYLVPDTVDQRLIIRRRDQIARVLRDFLPIQVRTVFIVDEVFTENVYTYDVADAEVRVVIGERMIDTIMGEVLWGPLAAANRGPFDAFEDRADFQWLETFAVGNDAGLLPDLNVHPPKLGFRLFLSGVDEKE